MSKLLRGVFILWVVFRFGLDELLLSSFKHPSLRMLTRILTLGRSFSAPRGQRLREALEALGPIFVKFGQVLSTRRDLLPTDIAEELARLQDRVPPFSSDVAVATIERALAKRWTTSSATLSEPLWPVLLLRKCTLPASKPARVLSVM